MIQGIDLRIVEGRKFQEDLRLEMRIAGQWTPLKMDLALFMVDFFAENERLRKFHMEGWSQNGDRYFLSKCIDASRRGWRAVADEIARFRERRAS